MNMKRLSLVFAVLLLAFTQHVHAQYYSVNYDARTVAAMAAAFGTEVVAESYYREQVDDILKHYTAAEVAAAGIFSSKFLEHKALSDLGIWCSSTENYYYRRIYHMVADKIIPKIWVVAKQMLHSPQTAIHWGSYLMKVCDETKSLCMQFESVVTNSTLSFSDIAFLEINSEVVPLLKLSELGGIDWQRMLDDFSRIPDRFTRENLQSDPGSGEGQKAGVPQMRHTASPSVPLQFRSPGSRRARQRCERAFAPRHIRATSDCSHDRATGLLPSHCAIPDSRPRAVHQQCLL